MINNDKKKIAFKHFNVKSSKEERVERERKENIKGE